MIMPMHPSFLIATAGIICTLASSTYAQSERRNVVVQPDSNESTAPGAADWDDDARIGDDDGEGGFGLDEFDVGFRWLSPASIDGGEGDVSMFRYGAQLGFEIEFENEIELSFGGEYLREDWSYDGEGSGLLPGVNEPWDGFERYGFEVGLSVPVGEWEIFGEIGIEWADEISANTSDSMLLEGFVAGRRQLWDNFDIVVGVFYGESFEDDDDILPLIGFDWRITDVDQLVLSRPREGYQLEYRRLLSDTLTLRGYGRFHSEEFRLDDDGPTNGGALSADEFMVGIGAELELGPGRAGVDVGYSFGREYEVFDDRGNSIFEPELDGAISVGVYYSIGF